MIKRTFIVFNLTWLLLLFGSFKYIHLTNDSWSDVAAPLEQYQIKVQPYHYTFYITPFNSTNKSAS